MAGSYQIQIRMSYQGLLLEVPPIRIVLPPDGKVETPFKDQVEAIIVTLIAIMQGEVLKDQIAISRCEVPKGRIAVLKCEVLKGILIFNGLRVELPVMPI